VAKTKTTEPQVGLLAACDTPELFAFNLWPRQRELLGHVETYRTHVWALGRRSGKSTMGALVCLHDALFSPHLLRHLRRRERRYAVVVATNLRQARLVIDAARSIVAGSPLLSRRLKSESDDELVFDTGCTVTAFPCTARGGRGWPISTLVFDEAAHHYDTEGNAAAEPLFRSLHPSTAQFGTDARVLILSTPFGSDGWFADTWQKAWDADPEDAVAARHTSAQMNPTLSSEFLSAEMARDPDGFRSEYLAEFVGSGGSFLDHDRIAAAVSERSELGRLDAEHWVLGLDLGFASDPTGVAIVGITANRPDVLRLALARAWAPTKTATFDQRRAVEDRVLGDVADLAEHYGASVVTDQHLAPAVRDFFSSRDVPVKTLTMTAETKTLAYSELRQRINTGTLELYDHPDLLAELRRLRTRYAAGKSSVISPRVGGSHGDVAQALALATWEHDKAGVGPPPHAAFMRDDPRDHASDSLDAMLSAPELGLGLSRLTPEGRL
jgi:hypothetical protein